MNTVGIAAAAAHESLDAYYRAFDRSPLDPYDVAYAVGMEQAERARKAKPSEVPTTVTLKKGSLLGCWVEGTLKFQSRDHGNVHEYAARKMAERHSVWVAPIGSFVEA